MLFLIYVIRCGLTRPSRLRAHAWRQIEGRAKIEKAQKLFA
jgi:hypothetical protein